MGRPIKPEEVGEQVRASIPPEVFDAFNEEIALNFSIDSAQVMQSAVIARIKSKINSFSLNWLNVEEAYREAGWKVEYDMPGYNETYQAYFVFTKR